MCSTCMLVEICNTNRYQTPQQHYTFVEGSNVVEWSRSPFSRLPTLDQVVHVSNLGFIIHFSFVLSYRPGKTKVHLWGLVNQSKVLHGYGFWGYSFLPPSSLKNCTTKTAPKKNWVYVEFLGMAGPDNQSLCIYSKIIRHMPFPAMISLLVKTLL